MMFLNISISFVTRVQASLAPFARTWKPALNNFSFMSAVPSTLSVSVSIHLMASGGVLAGASSTVSVANTKSLYPDSTMVGTSGMSGQRVSPVTARQRNVPALMCGAAGGNEPELSWQVPLSSACSASPPPLNTTSSSFGSFSASFNTSSWICGVVPIGGVAQLYFSGLALANAANSLIVLAGNSDFTTKVLGEVASSLTPTKSLSGSYGIFL